MYEVKSRIYSELTKTQKTALCSSLRILVKNFPNLSCEEVLDKFLEDETYYLKINSSRFEFLKDLIEDEKFISESKLFIIECRKYYDYKKSQEPLRQAQKEFEKEKRVFLRDVKMSKEPPTKKQLSYYKSLCKKYSEEKKELDELSKLDLRNEIDRILSEHQAG